MAQLPPHIPLPEGARLMTTDEAIQTIRSGDHVGSANGWPALDDAVIGFLEKGLMQIVVLPDGQIAMSVTSEQFIRLTEELTD